MLRRYEKGDTLIEVLLAFAIFSMAAVSTIVLLNQGVAIAERSLEKSLVRQQIDSQAELLRYLSATDDPAWAQVTNSAMITTTPMSLSQASCPDISNLGSKSFFVTQDSAGGFKVNKISTASSNYQQAPVFSQISYDTAAPQARGMWVEVVKAENGVGTSALDAYDFYIHTCWASTGTSVPMTVGTIVRIYGQ